MNLIDKMKNITNFDDINSLYSDAYEAEKQRWEIGNCLTCKEMTNAYFKENPEKKGRVICERCKKHAEESCNIVFLDLKDVVRMR